MSCRCTGAICECGEYRPIVFEPVADDDCPCLKPSHQTLAAERDQLRHALAEAEERLTSIYELAGWGGAHDALKTSGPKDEA